MYFVNPTQVSFIDGPVSCIDGPVSSIDGPVSCIDGPVSCIDGPKDQNEESAECHPGYKGERCQTSECSIETYPHMLQSMV